MSESQDEKKAPEPQETEGKATEATEAKAPRESGAQAESAPKSDGQADTKVQDGAAPEGEGRKAPKEEPGPSAEEKAKNQYEGLVRLLRRIDTFRHFSDHALTHQFLPASKVLSFKPGDVVLKEGELDTWVYFLINGQMRVVKRGVTLNQFGRQGDVFGEVSAIDGTARSASVIAAKPSTCLAFDLGKVDKLDPETRDTFLSILYRVFALKLAERLREADIKIVKLQEALARLRPQG